MKQQEVVEGEKFAPLAFAGHAQELFYDGGALAAPFDPPNPYTTDNSEVDEDIGHQIRKTE